MSKIEIHRAYKPVEVDLWGTKFETVDVTRSGSKQAAVLEREIDEISGADDGALDELVEKMGELLDIKLVAIEGRRKASTLVKKQWLADKMSIGELLTFLQLVQSAEAEGNRPT